MPIDVPAAGAPILDTWGQDVAERLNQLIPLIRSTQVDTNSTSLVDVLTFPVVSGRSYWINLAMIQYVDHASSQCQWGYDRPSGSSVIYARMASSGVTTEELQRIGATATATTFANAGGTGSQRHVQLWGQYVATADGTFRIQCARSGTSAGVHVVAGSGGLVIETV